jgi:hypothetical protein
MTIRRVAISISDIEVICEIREIDSPRIGFDIPRGQVPVKVSNALDTFKRRN